CSADRSAELRSPAQIPLRPRVGGSSALTRTGRIPLSDPMPAVPGGFAAKAFSGEVVPFRVVAFREGHDRIGVHVRLMSPTGVESLHRMTPLADGTDRWQS